MNYIERNRDFKGVWIPKEVWLNEELTMLEKVILTEIDSLDNEDHCTAGNEYLAQFCQCSEWKVSTAVKKLIELGYIEVVSFDGRHRRLKSCTQNLTHKNYEADIGNSKDSLLEIQGQTLENPKAASGKPKAINIANNLDSSIDDIYYNAETSSANESSSDNQNSPLVESTVEKDIDYNAPPAPPLPVAKPKRQSLKDQLTDYINSLSYLPETKDVMFKWLFAIGLTRNVRFEQFQDMIKKLWDGCNDEALFREAIEKSYLNGWFGFYPPKGYKPTPAPNPPATPKNEPSTPIQKAPQQVGCFTVY